MLRRLNDRHGHRPPTAPRSVRRTASARWPSARCARRSRRRSPRPCHGRTALRIRASTMPQRAGSLPYAVVPAARLGHRSDTVSGSKGQRPVPGGTIPSCIGADSTAGNAHRSPCRPAVLRGSQRWPPVPPSAAGEPGIHVATIRPRWSWPARAPSRNAAGARPQMLALRPQSNSDGSHGAATRRDSPRA
jgi:hypothetical protein